MFFLGFANFLPALWRIEKRKREREKKLNKMNNIDLQTRIIDLQTKN